MDGVSLVEMRGAGVGVAANGRTVGDSKSHCRYGQTCAYARALQPMDAPVDAVSQIGRDS